MAKINVKSEALAPAGQYQVNAYCVTEKTGGLYGPEVEIDLRVVKGPYAGRELKAWATIKNSPKSNLVKYCAAFGLDTSPDSALDTDDLIGRTAIAIVVIGSRNDGTEYNKIVGFAAASAVATTKPTNDDWTIPDGLNNGGNA